MDEMNIKSDFMQNLIAKIIRKLIKKQTGYDILVGFEGPIYMNSMGDQTRIHIDMAFEIQNEDLSKIVKGLV